MDRTDLAEALFQAIRHGNDEHQDWLRTRVSVFFSSTDNIEAVTMAWPDYNIAAYIANRRQAGVEMVREAKRCAKVIETEMDLLQAATTPSRDSPT